jgi:hypothetical protein
MKPRRIRSLRGSILVDGGAIKHQLILDDGRINHGLKILSFEMWSKSSVNQLGIDVMLCLAKLPSAQQKMNASDNRQIAWFMGGFDNYINTTEFRSIIDPDHVINRDLFIFGDATNALWNYLIIAEEYDLSDDEAIVQIIKETSQTSVQ